MNSHVKHKKTVKIISLLVCAVFAFTNIVQSAPVKHAGRSTLLAQQLRTEAPRGISQIMRLMNAAREAASVSDGRFFDPKLFSLSLETLFEKDPVKKFERVSGIKAYLMREMDLSSKPEQRKQIFSIVDKLGRLRTFLSLPARHLNGTGARGVPPPKVAGRRGSLRYKSFPRKRESRSPTSEARTFGDDGGARSLRRPGGLLAKTSAASLGGDEAGKRRRLILKTLNYARIRLFPEELLRRVRRKNPDFSLETLLSDIERDERIRNHPMLDLENNPVDLSPLKLERGKKEKVLEHAARIKAIADSMADYISAGVSEKQSEEKGLIRKTFPEDIPSRSKKRIMLGYMLRHYLIAPLFILEALKDAETAMVAGFFNEKLILLWLRACDEIKTFLNTAVSPDGKGNFVNTHDVDGYGSLTNFSEIFGKDVKAAKKVILKVKEKFMPFLEEIEERIWDLARLLDIPLQGHPKQNTADAESLGTAAEPREVPEEIKFLLSLFGRGTLDSAYDNSADGLGMLISTIKRLGPDILENNFFSRIKTRYLAQALSYLPFSFTQSLSIIASMGFDNFVLLLEGNGKIKGLLELLGDENLGRMYAGSPFDFALIMAAAGKLTLGKINSFIEGVGRPAAVLNFCFNSGIILEILQMMADDDSPLEACEIISVIEKTLGEGDGKRGAVIIKKTKEMVETGIGADYFNALNPFTRTLTLAAAQEEFLKDASAEKVYSMVHARFLSPLSPERLLHNLCEAGFEIEIPLKSPPIYDFRQLQAARFASSFFGLRRGRDRPYEFVSFPGYYWGAQAEVLRLLERLKTSAERKPFLLSVPDIHSLHYSVGISMDKLRVKERDLLNEARFIGLSAAICYGVKERLGNARIGDMVRHRSIGIIDTGKDGRYPEPALSNRSRIEYRALYYIHPDHLGRVYPWLKDESVPESVFRDIQLLHRAMGAFLTFNKSPLDERLGKLWEKFRDRLAVLLRKKEFNDPDQFLAERLLFARNNSFNTEEFLRIENACRSYPDLRTEVRKLKSGITEEIERAVIEQGFADLDPEDLSELPELFEEQRKFNPEWYKRLAGHGFVFPIINTGNTGSDPVSSAGTARASSLGRSGGKATNAASLLAEIEKIGEFIDEELASTLNRYFDTDKSDEKLLYDALFNLCCNIIHRTPLMRFYLGVKQCVDDSEAPDERRVAEWRKSFSRVRKIFNVFTSGDLHARFLGRKHESTVLREIKHVLERWGAEISSDEFEKEYWPQARQAFSDIRRELLPNIEKIERILQSFCGGKDGSVSPTDASSLGRKKRGSRGKEAVKRARKPKDIKREDLEKHLETVQDGKLGARKNSLEILTSWARKRRDLFKRSDVEELMDVERYEWDDAVKNAAAVLLGEIEKYRPELFSENELAGKRGEDLPEEAEADEDFKTGKRILSEIVLKSSDFNWAKEAKNIPSLKGRLIGFTNAGGNITFSPIPGGKAYTFAVLGKREKGWKAVVVREGVRKGRYEFTVELTKEGEEPVRRFFQAGRYTRKRKDVEVLDLSPAWGRYGLQELMNKPSDVDWRAVEDDLPNLKGAVLGQTDSVGCIYVTPSEGYPYRLKLISEIKGGGWNVVIRKGRVVNNYYVLTLGFSKKGEKTFTRDFIIGSSRITLKGKYSQKGNEKEFWDVLPKEKAGTAFIKHLITRPKDFDWKKGANDFPDLTGLFIGKADHEGRLSFNPVKGYRYIWQVVGKADPGWGMYFAGGNAVGNLYRFELEFRKDGEESFRRTFYLGYERIGLTPEGGRKRKISAWEIMTDPGQQMLAEILNNYGDVDWNKQDLPDLTGVEMGVTNTTGSIPFRVAVSFPYWFRPLGINDPGWLVTVHSWKIFNGRFELILKMTKEGQKPRYRYFHVGPFTTVLKGLYQEEGNEFEILDVSDRMGLEGISGLVIKEEGFDWEKNKRALPDLSGLRLGVTDKKGGFNFNPVTNHSYRWTALWQEEYYGGWEGVIMKSAVVDGKFRFVVRFTKNGKQPLYMLYEISDKEVLLRSCNAAKNGPERKKARSIKKLGNAADLLDKKGRLGFKDKEGSLLEDVAKLNLRAEKEYESLELKLILEKANELGLLKRLRGELKDVAQYALEGKTPKEISRYLGMHTMEVEDSLRILKEKIKRNPKFKKSSDASSLGKEKGEKGVTPEKPGQIPIFSGQSAKNRYLSQVFSKIGLTPFFGASSLGEKKGQAPSTKQSDKHLIIKNFAKKVGAVFLLLSAAEVLLNFAGIPGLFSAYSEINAWYVGEWPVGKLITSGLIAGTTGAIVERLSVLISDAPYYRYKPKLRFVSYMFIRFFLIGPVTYLFNIHVIDYFFPVLAESVPAGRFAAAASFGIFKSSLVSIFFNWWFAQKAFLHDLTSLQGKENDLRSVGEFNLETEIEINSAREKIREGQRDYSVSSQFWKTILSIKGRLPLVLVQHDLAQNVVPTVLRIPTEFGTGLISQLFRNWVANQSKPSLSFKVFAGIFLTVPTLIFVCGGTLTAFLCSLAATAVILAMQLIKKNNISEDVESSQESVSGKSGQGSGAASLGKNVDINNASKRDIVARLGVSKKDADEIIAARPISSEDDLRRISCFAAMPGKRFSKLLKKIIIRGCGKKKKRPAPKPAAGLADRIISKMDPIDPFVKVAIAPGTFFYQFAALGPMGTTPLVQTLLGSSARTEDMGKQAAMFRDAVLQFVRTEDGNGFMKTLAIAHGREVKINEIDRITVSFKFPDSREEYQFMHSTRTVQPLFTVSLRNGETVHIILNAVVATDINVDTERVFTDDEASDPTMFADEGVVDGNPLEFISGPIGLKGGGVRRYGMRQKNYVMFVLVKGYGRASYEYADERGAWVKRARANLLKKYLWDPLAEDLGEDGRALDVAVGRGRDIESAPAEILPRITATDYMSGPLKVLKERFPALETLRSDWRRLPLPDGRFKRIFGLNAISYVPLIELDDFVSEMDRLLAAGPDGTKKMLFLTDIAPLRQRFLGDTEQSSRMAAGGFGLSDGEEFIEEWKQKISEGFSRLGYRAAFETVKEEVTGLPTAEQEPLLRHGNVFRFHPRGSYIDSDPALSRRGQVREEIEMLVINVEKPAAKDASSLGDSSHEIWRDLLKEDLTCLDIGKIREYAERIRRCEMNSLSCDLSERERRKINAWAGLDLGSDKDLGKFLVTASSGFSKELPLLLLRAYLSGASEETDNRVMRLFDILFSSRFNEAFPHEFNVMPLSLREEEDPGPAEDEAIKESVSRAYSSPINSKWFDFIRSKKTPGRTELLRKLKADWIKPEKDRDYPIVYWDSELKQTLDFILQLWEPTARSGKSGETAYYYFRPYSIYDGLSIFRSPRLPLHKREIGGRAYGNICVLTPPLRHYAFGCFSGNESDWNLLNKIKNWKLRKWPPFDLSSIGFLFYPLRELSTFTEAKKLFYDMREQTDDAEEMLQGRRILLQWLKSIRAATILNEGRPIRVLYGLRPETVEKIGLEEGKNHWVLKYASGIKEFDWRKEITSLEFAKERDMKRFLAAAILESVNIPDGIRYRVGRLWLNAEEFETIKSKALDLAENPPELYLLRENLVAELSKDVPDDGRVTVVPYVEGRVILNEKGERIFIRDKRIVVRFDGEGKNYDSDKDKKEGEGGDTDGYGDDFSEDSKASSLGGEKEELHEIEEKLGGILRLLRHELRSMADGFFGLWQMLLDAYASNELRERFEGVAVDLKRQFESGTVTRKVKRLTGLLRFSRVGLEHIDHGRRFLTELYEEMRERKTRDVSAPAPEDVTADMVMAASRIETIFKDIARLKKASMGVYSLDLVERLERIIKFYSEHITGYGASIKTELGNHPVNVMFAGITLRPIFENLITNALTAGAWEITVKISLDENAERAVVSFADDSPGVFDAGGGKIAPENLNVVFANGFTSKAGTEMHGLGGKNPLEGEPSLAFLLKAADTLKKRMGKAEDGGTRALVQRHLEYLDERILRVKDLADTGASSQPQGSGASLGKKSGTEPLLLRDRQAEAIPDLRLLSRGFAAPRNDSVEVERVRRTIRAAVRTARAYMKRQRRLEGERIRVEREAIARARSEELGRFTRRISASRRRVKELAAAA